MLSEPAKTNTLSRVLEPSPLNQDVLSERVGASFQLHVVNLFTNDFPVKPIALENFNLVNK